MSRVLLRRGRISPWVHGTLDYPLAAALIAGPLLLDFDNDTATRSVFAIAGVATVLAVGTNWSHAIMRVIPPAVHGMLGIGALTPLIAASRGRGRSVIAASNATAAPAAGGSQHVTALTRDQPGLLECRAPAGSSS